MTMTDAPVSASDEWCSKCGAKLLRQRVFIGVPKAEEFTLAAEEPDSTTEPFTADESEHRESPPPPAEASVAPPASNVPHPRWGGFFRRSAAFMIDMTVILFLTALMAVMSYIGYKVGLAAHDRVFSWSTANPLYSMLTIGALGLASAYFVVFHGMEGKTIGKWLLGLRVVGEAESTISFGRAFLRWIGTVGLGGASLGLAFLWILWQREKRGWHDLLARTWVIRE